MRYSLHLPYRYVPTRGQENYTFDESKIRRAEDGRFGDKAGEGDESKKMAKQKTWRDKMREASMAGKSGWGALSEEELSAVISDWSASKDEKKWAKKELNSRGVTVKRKPKLTLRQQAEFMSESDKVEFAKVIEVDEVLIKSGAKLDAESDSGSRYYTLPSGKKVRLADHEANEATQNWKDRADVFEIRTDKSSWRNALQEVLDAESQASADKPVPATPANPKSKGK